MIEHDQCNSVFCLLQTVDQRNRLGPMQKRETSGLDLHNEKSRMIEHFMGQVKTEDLLNIGFMKPIEVALRTNKNDKNVPQDSLPKGLMIACKGSINDNKYSLAPILPVQEEHRFLEDLKAKHMDNYISLLKKPETKDEIEAERMSIYRQTERLSRSQRATVAAAEVQPEPTGPKHQGTQIGICVSMSGETKKSLKKTLVGVANNIDQLIRSGVSPDDMFVLVMIDGVRKVDPSLYEYFEQFQRESQIFLQQDQKLTLRKKYEHQLFHSEVQGDQPLNYSKFLFKEHEFHERIDSKFINIRKKYDEVLQIKGSIQNIKKQNNKDNQNLKMIVNRLADKQKNILKKIKGKKERVVISEESIMKELAAGEEECNQYVNTRQDLAYVAVYRVPTTSLSEDCRIKYNDLARQERAEGAEQEQADSERLMNDQMEENPSRDSKKEKQGGISKSLLYVNLFICIKYKQAGKLNSHNWFFNGFCQELKPRYSFLLDVGVKPYRDSIFKMYRHMRVNPKVGGVCGYLRLVEEMIEDEEMVKEEDVDCMTSVMNNFFDIQRAQQIETHYEHFMQKSFEALFRFIHVVPGSFSGYSMQALRPPGKKGDELLRQYFRSVDQKITTNKIVPSEFTPGRILARILLPKTIWKRFIKIDPDSQEQLLYNENTYQAENRILCLGIHKNKKDISFMPNVYAQVEPIKNINELMESKKLEINGGQFSFEKVQDQFGMTIRKREKFLVRFQLLYLSFLKFIGFFAPALLIFGLQFATEIMQTQFLASLFASQSTTGLGDVIYKTFSNIIIFIYTLCILAIFFFSIHLNSREKKYVYYAHLISTILGIFTIIAALIFIVQTLMSVLQFGDNYLQKNYIIQLRTFLSQDLAKLVATVLRVVIFLALATTLLPAFFYSFFFGKFGILWETIVGMPAYIFYFPTYICILPIYARCRLDDIYSGDSFKSSAAIRNQKLKQTWNIVKMIDVSKYLFWNTVVAFALLLSHQVLLVKFFMLLLFLAFFSIISLIKIIPGIVYMIRYKWNKRTNPIELTQEERENSISEMKLRVFDIVKRFEDDFTFNIKESFEEAAALAEAKEIERKEKLAKKQEKRLNGRDSVVPKEPSLANRNQSIQMSNLLQMNGHPSLTSKLQTIRESSALKSNFYPFQVGKKEAKTAESSNIPLQMVLLKNRIASQAVQNKDLKEDEIKLKKYQNFRTTIKPIG